MKASYQVTFSTAKLEFDPRKSERLSQAFFKAGFSLTNPEFIAIVKDCMKCEEVVKVFEHDEPIEARKAAMRHAWSYWEVLSQANLEADAKHSTTNDLLTHGLDPKRFYSNISVDFIFHGEPIRIMQTVDWDNRVQCLEREYLIYTEQGYRIEVEPIRTFIPELGREILTIPA